jgi:UDP-N-acetylmuramoyl-L-alanyl-D-glutamate--2,6-diaminopimelate ligase
LSGFKEKRIITVFGCGGDRDRGKRPLMGKAAAELSDLTIVTSDNPRTEDPFKIISEIEAGIKENLIKKYVPDELSGGLLEKGYIIMPDRREAIGLAVSIADNSDIILIAGKGHEKYQITGETKISFDDVIVAREALARRQIRGA